ncbi:MAG TPA: hypothetical protein PK597_08170, partial [Oscillospiraceae bacterium]|nr:hypothetical protein [Oscillospiraceae bacterium]
SDFLRRHGMHPQRAELSVSAAAFLELMEAGLRGKSSVPMIPTYLRAEGELPKDVPVAVVDLGGTNLRVARVTLTDEGPRVEGLTVVPAPGASKPVSWASFIGAVADLLLPILPGCDRVGFSFAHPAVMTPNHDGRVISLTKQVRVTGARGRFLCASLSEALAARGAGGLRFVALNDTAAVLCAGLTAFPPERYDGCIGLVWGTGFNVCCALDAARLTKLSHPPEGTILVNQECGGFEALPQGDADRLLDSFSVDPGVCVCEKMVSGVYWGELLRRTLALAADDGLLSRQACTALFFLPHLSAAEADAFVRAPAGDNPLARICATGEDRAFVRAVLFSLADRAARLVCANLTATLLLTGAGRDAARPVCVVTEGSVICRGQLAQPMLESYLEQFTAQKMGRHCVLSAVPNANFAGIAAAALLNS